MNFRLAMKGIFERIRDNPLTRKYREHNERQWQETVARDEEHLKKQINCLCGHIDEIEKIRNKINNIVREAEAKRKKKGSKRGEGDVG